MSRVYNFSAGPAVLPEEVLKEAQEEMMDYRGCGMSVMEMSHRSSMFQEIIDEAEADLRDLMGIPDNYKVLFLQGGATLHFATIPMNLMKNGVADYIITGQWAKKAYQEAKKYGKVNVVASSEDKTYTYIPDCSDLPISEDADYVYICQNNTIYGTVFHTLPNTKGKTLVADVSSCFLSEPIDVEKYGVIYGGVQKNIGPSGVQIVIIREDLLREDLPDYVPTMMNLKMMADKGSMYNTPPCYGIYICGKVFKWIKSLGASVLSDKAPPRLLLFCRCACALQQQSPSEYLPFQTSPESYTMSPVPAELCRRKFQKRYRQLQPRIIHLSGMPAEHKTWILSDSPLPFVPYTTLRFIRECNII